eukprot:851404-Rhodomonas_salina.1
MPGPQTQQRGERDRREDTVREGMPHTDLCPGSDASQTQTQAHKDIYTQTLTQQTHRDTRTGTVTQA